MLASSENWVSTVSKMKRLAQSTNKVINIEVHITPMEPNGRDTLYDVRSSFLMQKHPTRRSSEFPDS